MSNRHLARSIVLQSLYEWDFNRRDKDTALEIARLNIEEFGPGLTETDYIIQLVEGIIKVSDKLDEIIEQAATDWPIEKISIIDRNTLRIGLFELLYADRKEVPAKVAINEAIELAKTFGGDNSGKFINGVMGTVYKLIGEPGKEEQSKKKITDPAKMPKEYLAGALVYKKENGEYSLALVHDVFGYWTLSKGHLEDDEDKRQGAKREIKEELGIDVDVEEQIGENEYTALDPEKGNIRKHVYYFLASTKDKELSLGKVGGGLLEAKWFLLDNIANLKIYDDILPIITKGIKLLPGKT